MSTTEEGGGGPIFEWAVGVKGEHEQQVRESRGEPEPNADCVDMCLCYDRQGNRRFRRLGKFWVLKETVRKDGTR